jgi:anti-anti-sigma factor
MVEHEGANGDPGHQFEIVSRRLADGIVLVMSGEIDLATASTVEHELLRAEQSHDLVALDLSNLSFMDSTGLHVIVVADRRMRERGGRLLIVQGPPQIRRVFELTGVADHMELVRDAAELERAAAA